MKKVFLTLALLFLPLTVNAASGLGLVNPNHPGYNPNLITEQVQAQAQPANEEVQRFCYDQTMQLFTFKSPDEARDTFTAWVKENPNQVPEEVFEWFVPMVLEMIDKAEKEGAEAAYNHCLANQKLGDLI